MRRRQQDEEVAGDSEEGEEKREVAGLLNNLTIDMGVQRRKRRRISRRHLVWRWRRLARARVRKG